MKRTAAPIILSAILLFGSFFKIEAKRDDFPVTPALNIISRSVTLVKAGMCDEEIGFTNEDFEKASGVKNIKALTVVSVPEVLSGKLLLGSREVMKNEVISADEIPSLRFLPSFEYPTEAVFKVKISGYSGDEITCSLYTLKEINYAPVSGITAGDGKEPLKTYRNISVFGKMKCLDPENDNVTYEVTKQPQKGLLSVIDRHTGAFSYTPITNFTGTDSFTYTATDKYGNSSKPIEITVSVEKSKSGVVFTDLIGHWAHNAAIKVSTAGIMGAENVNGKLHFNPNEPMTRCEFLSMALMSAGVEPGSMDAETVFKDDSQIPTIYKPYVNTAFEMGIIKGSSKDTETSFYPGSLITRAECAVILNNLLDLSAPVMKPYFADSDEIPVWAETALYALNCAEILNGTSDGYLSPNSVITRAQGAQIFAAVMEMKK